jgi:hypothetical protein
MFRAGGHDGAIIPSAIDGKSRNWLHVHQQPIPSTTVSPLQRAQGVRSILGSL